MAGSMSTPARSIPAGSSLRARWARSSAASPAWRPKVMNATRNYNYAEDIYIQISDQPARPDLQPVQHRQRVLAVLLANVLSTGGCMRHHFCAPAYLAENAIPTGGHAPTTR